jgi:hypothetical protein
MRGEVAMTPTDGPTEVSLENMGVKSIEELLTLDTPEIAHRLGDAPFPPSEKLIGAVVLVALDRLQTATADLSESSRKMDSKTGRLVDLARLALAVAVVSLLVALAAVVIAAVK